MSVLLPSTRKLLEKVRPSQPLFANQVLAEQFEARHTLGPLRVLPRTVGGYVVIDERRPVGDRVVEVVEGSEELAHKVLERLARTEAPR